MQREVVKTDQAPGAIGPYSQAIRAEGQLLFCSGQISLLPNGELIQGSVQDQAKQCLSNLMAVLASQGLTAANVVKTTIFLSSMDHFAAVNETYATFFNSDPPARSTVAVAGLPKGVDVEIEAIAVF
jgi:2-iminobutanoate/2-iminopropanoate deaminase